MAGTERSFRGVSPVERRAVRRARLLDAGLELVGRQGWSAMTMTAVCREAGLTERYFYESFSGLADLQRMLMDQVAGEVNDAISAAIASTPGPPVETLRAVAAGVLHVLTNDPRRGRVALFDGLADGELQLKRREILRSFEDTVTEHAPEVFGSNAADPVRRQLTAASLIGAADELISRRLRGELLADDEQLVAHLLALAAAG